MSSPLRVGTCHYVLMTLRSAAVVAGLLLVVAAACGQETSPEGGGNGGGEADPPSPEVTIESLGGEAWPVGEAGYDVPYPAAPAGFTEADVAELADLAVEWSQSTSLDPGTFTSADPGSIAMDPLPQPTASSLIGLAEQGPIPTLLVANAWTDVADYGDPRITVGWDAETYPGSPGGDPVLTVTLQSRAFYPISTREGEESVMAIIRWHMLSSLGELSRSDASTFTASAGWAVAGAKDCELLTEEMFIPLPIEEHETDEYERHIEAMEFDGVYEYSSEDGEDVTTEEYQERCGGESL